MIELLIVMGVILIMLAISVPVIQQTLASYRLSAGVAAISGAIQTTRYQAISNGYPFRVKFSKTGLSYQLSTCGIAYDPSTTTPDTCAYSNTGNAVPLEGASNLSLGADTAFQFTPGGKVTVSTGAQPLTLSSVFSGTSKTKNITVSTYGNVKVQ